MRREQERTLRRIFLSEGACVTVETDYTTLGYHDPLRDSLFWLVQLGASESINRLRDSILRGLETHLHLEEKTSVQK